MGTIIRGWRGMLGGAGLLASGLLAGCESTSPRNQGVGSPSAPMVSRGSTAPTPAQPWNQQPNYASTTRPTGAGPTTLGSMNTIGTTGTTGSMGGMTASPTTGMGTTLPGSGMPTMNSPAGYGTPATGTGATGSTLSPMSSLQSGSGVSQAGYATAQPTRLSAAPTYQTGGYEQSTPAGTALPSVPQPPAIMNSSAQSAPALPGAAGMPTMGNGR